MRLDDLRRVFGGCIRQLDDRRWLETHVGGLRTFVSSHAIYTGSTAFDLAVFTPHTLELDPFDARDEGQEWRLDGDLVVPRLRREFVFAGCRSGILFARSHTAPSLENMVSTLWDLAAWARLPWRPVDNAEERAASRASDQARIRRERWSRVGWVMVLIALILLLRNFESGR